MAQRQRSGRAIGLLIGGIAVLVTGLFGGLFVVVMWAVTGEAGLLLILLLLPLAVIVGGLLLFIGLRSGVQITHDAVSWSAGFGGTQLIPFAQIAHIEVPTARRGPGGVQLHLRDGQMVPLTALKMSRDENGYSPDRAYRRIAEQLVQAHQQYLQRAGQH